MRFVFGLILLSLLLVSLAFFWDDAAAFTRSAAPLPGQSLVRDAKIVCGDFGQGYTCRRESGAIRRGKMPKIPGSSSESSGGGLFGGGGGLFGGESDDPDALPPPSAETGGGTSPDPNAQAASCPANSELLGGHCIPYTQRCTAGISPTAYPPQCKGEEKQVCSFHPDGTKDCCCRTYAKF